MLSSTFATAYHQFLGLVSCLLIFVDDEKLKVDFDYSLDRLIKDAKAKFDWHIDRVTLASQFVKVKEISDLPTMLVFFDKTKMEEFFLFLAKSLSTVTTSSINPPTTPSESSQPRPSAISYQGGCIDIIRT